MTRPDTVARPDTGFDDGRIAWRAFGSAVPVDADGRHPSDGLRYWVLGASEPRQTVDILFRLDPGAVCQPHRHLGPTSTLVVSGLQQNLALRDGGWTVVQDRPVGFFTSNEGDHYHREGGGPDGAVVHLTMTAVDGVIWQVIADDHRTVLAEARVSDFVDVLRLQAAGSSKPPRPGSGL